jgi:putative nucleotidyltransferase with HDIG domain
MQFTIIEELWFGDFSDEAAEKEAAHSLAAQAAKIVGLRPFPLAAQRLMAVARNPDYSVATLQEIVEGDPSLAARLLRLVNSSAYGLRRKCTSVQHAIMLLGGRALADLAAAVAVFDMVKNKADAQLNAMREHACVVAGLARQLAVSNALPSDDVFTCGLLHDLGKMLQLQLGDDSYPQLVREVEHRRDALHVLERERYGFDHAVLAGHVLRSWSIPDPVPQVVAWHHQVTRAYQHGGQPATMVSLLRLADRMAYELEINEGEPDEERLASLAKDEAVAYLGLPVDTLESMWLDLQLTAMESRLLASS